MATNLPPIPTTPIPIPGTPTSLSTPANGKRKILIIAVSVSVLLIPISALIFLFITRINPKKEAPKTDAVSNLPANAIGRIPILISDSNTPSQLFKIKVNTAVAFNNLSGKDASVKFIENKFDIPKILPAGKTTETIIKKAGKYKLEITTGATQTLEIEAE